MTVAHLFQAGKFAWMNGKIEEVDPRLAIHLPLLSQAVDYARVVISGMRVTPHFRDPGKLLIFSLADHVARLLDSCSRMGLPIPFDAADLQAAVIEAVRANAAVLLPGGYLRAVVYDARPVLAPQSEGPGTVAIFAGPFGEYIPDGDFRCTLNRQVSVGQRGRTKAAANYVGFSAAKVSAQALGLDDALGVMLARGGELIIGEGTTSNAFFVFDSPNGEVKIVTPPLDAGILAGVTRQRTIEFVRHLGYVVGEKDVFLDEVALAREIWLTGTASYVAPFTHLGRHPLKTEVGQRLNTYLRDVMAGRIGEFAHLNTEVLVRR